MNYSEGMHYSIGEPTNPMEDDRQFETIEVAEIKAIARSMMEGGVWAVWDEEGETVSLAFEGTVYRP